MACEKVAVPAVHAKRAFDVAATSILLVGLSPIMGLIAVRLKLERNGPVIYRGLRVGLCGRQFRMYKFRSMIVDADKLGSSNTANNDHRITRTGAVLRRYKLDELPQLINVLKGDMSLVGPRPEVPSQVAKWSKEERQLLRVRPGITDWASVRFHDEGAILAASGDVDGTYEELLRPQKTKLALDYVHHRNLRTDLAILGVTACLPLWRVMCDVGRRVAGALQGPH